MADETPLRTVQEQIGALASRVDHLTAAIEDQHPRPLFEWRRRRAPHGSMVDVLEYYERQNRKSVGVYYVIVGALTLSVALGLSLGSAPLVTIPLFVRLIVASLCAPLALANWVCIFYPREGIQTGATSGNTVAAFVIALLLIWTIALRDHAAMTAGSVVFWGILVVSHAVFTSAIHGRLEYRAFMLQMIHLARQGEAGAPPDTQP